MPEPEVNGNPKTPEWLVAMVDATLGIEKVRVRTQVRLSHLIKNKYPDIDIAKLGKAELKRLRIEVDPALHRKEVLHKK